jgi:hypothetical protein
MCLEPVRGVVSRQHMLQGAVQVRAVPSTTPGWLPLAPLATAPRPSAPHSWSMALPAVGLTHLAGLDVLAAVAAGGDQVAPRLVDAAEGLSLRAMRSSSVPPGRIWMRLEGLQAATGCYTKLSTMELCHAYAGGGIHLQDTNLPRERRRARMWRSCCTHHCTCWLDLFVSAPHPSRRSSICCSFALDFYDTVAAGRSQAAGAQQGRVAIGAAQPATATHRQQSLQRTGYATSATVSVPPDSIERFQVLLQPLWQMRTLRTQRSERELDLVVQAPGPIQRRPHPHVALFVVKHGS